MENFRPHNKSDQSRIKYKNLKTQISESDNHPDIGKRVMEVAPLSIIITDAEGTIEYVNRFFSDITGYSSEEVVGKNLRFLKGQKHSDEFYKKLWQKISSGSTWSGEFCNKKKGGDFFWEKGTISPVFNDRGEITNFIAIKEDITELKDIKKAMLQAQKIESIGVLTSGIAHDFNNLLTAIFGNADLLLSKMKADNIQYKELEDIIEYSQKASSLTRQLLLFTKKTKTEIQNVNVNQTILDLHKMLVRLIGEDIRIQLDLMEKKKFISINPVYLEQIILNICINAADSIRESRKKKKEIIISTSCRYHEQHSLTDMKKLYCFISIKDTGTGIPETIKNEIFDPFFTTKEKGTGLGLATVKTIVEETNGKIFFNTKDKTGTQFELCWPVSEIPEPVASEKKSVQNTIPPNLTALIVEDNINLLKLKEQMLKRICKKIFCVTSGEEALKCFLKNEESINLVIADIVLEGIDGVTLVSKIKAMKNNIKVIFSSGYAHCIENLPEIDNRNYAFLQKPYNLEKLSNTISEMFIE